MKRKLLLLFACFIAFVVKAQYPYTQHFDVRVGQQRPKCQAMVQDPLGLLWVASDMGLLRTDGDHTDLVWEANGASITALTVGGKYVYAATSTGVVLKCTGYGCDTLFADTLLSRLTARCLLAQPALQWRAT